MNTNINKAENKIEDKILDILKYVKFTKSYELKYFDKFDKICLVSENEDLICILNKEDFKIDYIFTDFNNFETENDYKEKTFENKFNECHFCTTRKIDYLNLDYFNNLFFKDYEVFDDELDNEIIITFFINKEDYKELVVIYNKENNQINITY